MTDIIDVKSAPLARRDAEAFMPVSVAPLCYSKYRLDTHDARILLGTSAKRDMIQAARSFASCVSRQPRDAANGLFVCLGDSMAETKEERRKRLKLEWQRQWRREFKKKHGYSRASHYSTGGLRGKVLRRDGYACVACGMTDEEHKAEWGRPITIDHIDRDRSNNTMDNLRTMCLRCHGSKDISPELTRRQVAHYKAVILKRREHGHSYQSIADDLGFSIAAIWKWCKRWEAA